jgi:hypothetical protein
MKETADATGRFPALDELGAEFLRVARAESLPRRRFRLRRVALALAVTLVVVPAGLALAQEDGSDSGTAAGDSSQARPEDFLDPPFFDARVKPLLNEPGVASRLEAMGYEGASSMSEGDFAELDAAAFLADLRAALDARIDYLREHPSEVNDVNVIGAGFSTEFVRECRANPNYDPHGWCGIELAEADGKLPPGRYTDAELQAAVRAAGYDWIPSD